MEEEEGANLPHIAPQQGSERGLLPPQDFPAVHEQVTTDAGRYLVTSRKVSGGELLAWEAPVALGPRSVSPLICLGCHSLIPEPEIPRCPGCWWPMCSPACAVEPRHQAECAVLARDKKRMAQPKVHGATPRYDVILTTRCLLLKERDPESWNRLAGLVSHASRRQEEGDEGQNATVTYVTQVLNVSLDDVDTALFIRDVIVTNSFEVRGPNGASLRGIYTLMARLNHACCPSVAVSTDNDNVMYVSAAVNMDVGAPLHVTYALTTQPLWERQALTSKMHYFNCECARCTDPTEMGLYYSSPRCDKCDHQYLEPNTWLGEVTWECPECPANRSGADIIEEVRQWESRFDSQDTFRYTTPHAVRAFLQKVEAMFHPNHHIWVRAAQTALTTLHPDNSTPTLDLKQDLRQRLLALYDVLEPGFTRRRGVSLYELGAVEAALARAERQADILTTHFYLLSLRQALHHLEEASSILILEPARSTGHNWYLRTQREIEEVKRDLELATSAEQINSTRDASFSPQIETHISQVTSVPQEITEKESELVTRDLGLNSPSTQITFSDKVATSTKTGTINSHVASEPQKISIDLQNISQAIQEISLAPRACIDILQKYSQSSQNSDSQIISEDSQNASEDLYNVFEETCDAFKDSQVISEISHIVSEGSQNISEDNSENLQDISEDNTSTPNDAAPVSQYTTPTTHITSRISDYISSALLIPQIASPISQPPPSSTPATPTDSITQDTQFSHSKSKVKEKSPMRRCGHIA